MKLNIQSAQDQMFSKIEDIYSLEKLNIEINDLNSIIESLDTDEYSDTRFNLDVIMNSKVNEGMNLLIEKLNINESEVEHKGDRNIVSNFFNKTLPYLQKHYEKFKKHEIIILKNTSNDTKVSKLLNDIGNILGQYKSVYEKLTEHSSFSGMAIIVLKLLILSIIPITLMFVLSGLFLFFGLIGFVILFIVGKLGWDERVANKAKLTNAKIKYETLISDVGVLSKTKDTKVIINNLEEILKNAKEGIKILKKSVSKLK